MKVLNVLENNSLMNYNFTWSMKDKNHGIHTWLVRLLGKGDFLKDQTQIIRFSTKPLHLEYIFTKLNSKVHNNRRLSFWNYAGIQLFLNFEFFVKLS